MTEKVKSVKVVEDPEVPTEVIAAAIVKMSNAFDKLLAAGLTQNAIVLLVWDATDYINGRKLTRNEVKTVLQALKDLKRMYVK